MPELEVAADVGERIRELRQLFEETQPVFARRFGRGWQQVSSWERGEHRPPASVLERAAEQNHWPIAIFAEGGPRPADVVVARGGGPRTDVPAPTPGLQAAVNAALTDVVRWTAEGLTTEQAATRAIQLITALTRAAQAEAEATAGETAALIDALRRRIGDLGEGRGAAASGPPVPMADAG